MTKRKASKRCPECGGPMVREARPDVISYGGASRRVQLTAWWCTKCGEAVLEGEDAMARDRVFQDLRAEVDDVLSPAQVRAAREAIGLTPAEAAERLGGGAKAFYKYESGEAPPSVPMSNLLRLLARHPALLDELGPRGAEGAPQVGAEGRAGEAQAGIVIVEG